MKKNILFVFLLLIAFQSLFYGQTPEQDKLDHERNKQKAAQAAYDSIPKPNSPTAPADAPTIPLMKMPNGRVAEAKRVRQEILVKLKELRAPNPEDLNKYNDFLKQKNTGLFKLFPDLACDTKYVVRVDSDCGNLVQDSWSYSFLYRDYGGSDIYDLRLKNEKLIADGFLSQSILVSLGDIDLENVLLTTNGMNFLTNFKPDLTSKEAKTQFTQIAKKIISDGFTYGKVVNLNESLTYGMRIIAYQLADKGKIDIREARKSMLEEEARFFMLNYEKRRDKIIAFRIVRKDSDGSVTILWKELSDKKAPILVFDKNEKLTDLKNQ